MHVTRSPRRRIKRYRSASGGRAHATPFALNGPFRGSPITSSNTCLCTNTHTFYGPDAVLAQFVVLVFSAWLVIAAGKVAVDIIAAAVPLQLLRSGHRGREHDDGTVPEESPGSHVRDLPHQAVHHRPLRLSQTLLNYTTIILPGNTLEE